MEKRYQVFVSSTYDDLKEERQAVMQALLELDCIPSGMELFPATNLDQWTLIQNVIDECDYYIVILGGRYGSVGSENIGYTEMEYRYAESIKKPIIAFLHNDLDSIVANKTELDPEKREKLKQFREYVEKKVCKYWESPPELGAVVTTSMVRLIKDFPAIGWIRSNVIVDPIIYKENNQLRKRIEELELELSSYGYKAPEGVEDIAQGDDAYTLEFILQLTQSGSHPDYKSKWANKTIEKSASWNSIFKALLPSLISESCTKYDINRTVTEQFGHYRNTKIEHDENSWSINQAELASHCTNDIIVQLHALGLIIPNKKRGRSIEIWKLTPHGNQILNQISAIKKLK